MAKLWEFVLEYLRSLSGIKKKSQILNKNTLPYSISERPIQEAKNSSSKWPGGHKSDNLLDQSQEREERETKIVVDLLYIQ